MINHMITKIGGVREQEDGEGCLSPSYTNVSNPPHKVSVAPVSLGKASDTELFSAVGLLPAAGER
jgi:hypothetical protein